MIITQEMEEPVDEERFDLPPERVSRSSGLARGRGNGYDDIAEQIRLNPGKLPLAQGKRQYVGGPVLPAVTPVQRSHGAIADEENAQLGFRKADARQQAPEFFLERRCRQSLFLLSVFYSDVHCAFYLRRNPRPDSRSADGRCRSGSG